MNNSVLIPTYYKCINILISVVTSRIVNVFQQNYNAMYDIIMYVRMVYYYNL